MRSSGTSLFHTEPTHSAPSSSATSPSTKILCFLRGPEGILIGLAQQLRKLLGGSRAHDRSIRLLPLPS